MANYKTCNNGHNYDPAKHAVCPFCPGNSGTPDYEQTMVDFKKTQGLEDGYQQFAKTLINEDKPEFKTTGPMGNSQSQFKRTSLVGEGETSADKGQQSERRKLVGWLVTFTHDELGTDFRLFAGKNRIGSSQGNDVCISDSSVSGEHATILFRDNAFLIKDHFSTNGTKINGTMIDEGRLQDGDELTLGNTVFRFKAAF